MNADERRTELDRLTERIVGCAYEVSNTLGCGFLEKVYENALAVELRRAGLRVEQQKLVQVRYKGELVGEGILDLLVEDAVIVEVKAGDALDTSHTAQCLNYLKATERRVCLLFNFGKPRVQMRRLVREF
jgi:GxxExxY protein